MVIKIADVLEKKGRSTREAKSLPETRFRMNRGMKAEKIRIVA